MRITWEYATMEASNWLEIHSDYCIELKWTVRAKAWMGIPAVIMPRLNQFIAKEEGLIVWMQLEIALHGCFI